MDPATRSPPPARCRSRSHPSTRSGRSTTGPPSTPASPSTSPRSTRSPRGPGARPSRTPSRRWSAPVGLLDRTMRVFHEMAKSMATPEMQELESGARRRFSAHSDACCSTRVCSPASTPCTRRPTGSTPEQRRLVGRHHTDFVRAGASLAGAAAAPARAQRGDQQADHRFGTTLLAAANAGAVHVTDRPQLAGLSEDAVESAAHRRQGARASRATC